MSPSLSSLLLAAISGLALYECLPLSLRRSAGSSSTPSVDVANGTYYGATNQHYTQEFFWTYHMPSRRLARCDSHHLSRSTRRSTSHALQLISPAGTKAGDDLPVAVWVHGVLQSYAMGGSRYPRYNLTLIVHQFVEGKPIVAASINYRPTYWGFLFSQEMQDVGTGSIAFRDQWMDFRCIQYNIAAFGGNRDKVTIWGESAAARSLGMQLVAYNGNDGYLFYSAILEGGSPAAGTTPLSLTSPTLTAVIDEDFITDQDSNLLRDGKFAQVPILLGNNFDEGTAYANTGINTKAQFQSYLATLGLATNQITSTSILYLHGRLPREESKQVGKRVCPHTRDGSFVLGTSIDDKLYTIELRGPWSR
ncbi:carboxylesterase family protein [Seiridium cupressi]